MVVILNLCGNGLRNGYARVCSLIWTKSNLRRKIDMKELSSQSGSTSVDGAILRYGIEGSGIPTLVIGSVTYYPRTFSQRLRQTFRLAFVDVRHFSQIDASRSPDTITLNTYTDDIEQVRMQLGFERAVVIGHSHHGNLALEYAKQYPAKVSHVVLIGSPPCNVEKTIKGGEEYWEGHASEIRKAALRDNWVALNREMLAAMSPEQAYIAQYVADGPKYWYDPTYNASSLWKGVPMNMDSTKVFRGFFTDYELSWDEERLRAPVLVVMGRHDYEVPHILWDEVLPTLRNVTFHLFERSGHTPQLEEPERFDQLLLEWLGTARPALW
jgi:proline iminopeptidase